MVGGSYTLAPGCRSWVFGAPVFAVHEIDIEAPLDTVWRLHTDVNTWPTWQTDITAAHIDGAF